MASFTLPPDFLAGKAPNLIKKDVNFKKTDIPQYDGLYATVLDNVFTKSECDDLVRAAEAQNNGQWDQAMVNVGGGRQVLSTDTRNCGRIIFDDREMAAKIWARCQDAVLPDIGRLKGKAKITGNGPAMRKEVWKMERLNERMRFLKYTTGQYFRAHVDGCYATDGNEEVSYFTLHLYLNEASPESENGKLEGGATTFHAMNMIETYDVVPKVGRVLIFQHRGLLHSGADVTAGVKLTMRTDLMYKKVS